MSDLTKHSALVVVPAYNAEKYIPEIVPRLRQFVCEENLLFINVRMQKIRLVYQECRRQKTIKWLDNNRGLQYKLYTKRVRYYIRKGSGRKNQTR